jgi:hypothetical protein
MLSKVQDSGKERLIGDNRKNLDSLSSIFPATTHFNMAQKYGKLWLEQLMTRSKTTIKFHYCVPLCPEEIEYHWVRLRKMARLRLSAGVAKGKKPEETTLKVGSHEV